MYLRTMIALCLSSMHLLLCYEETDTDGRRILKSLNMDPKHVSDHEIVKIESPGRLHKRNLRHRRSVNIRALGMDINLLLQPTDSIFASDETPVYYANYTPAVPYQVSYEEIIGAMKRVGKLLEDPKHFASVVLGTDGSGRMTLNGFLRSRRDNTPLVIRSLPDHVVDGYLRNRRSIDELSNDSTDSTYHLVARLRGDYSSHESIRDVYKAVLRRNDSETQSPGLSSYTDSNDGKPDTMYPEIVIHVDSTYLKDLSARGLEGFLEYLLAFWNAVDMVFRHVDYPKFRLSIAGIVISMHPRATPYIAENMLVEDAFECYRAIHGASRFHFSMRNRIPFDNCDIVAVMTHLKMGTKERPDAAKGIAFEGMLCEVSFTDRIKFGVLLAEDDGGFTGIIGAAHELGHSFGMHHDVDPPLVNCPPGFVMGASPPAQNAAWLSTCSLDAIRKSYDAGKYECMYDKPILKGNELPKLMAGKIDDLTKQCAALNLGPPFVELTSIDICVQFECWTTFERDSIVATGIAAAPGTPCGNGNDVRQKVCLKNRCVDV